MEHLANKVKRQTREKKIPLLISILYKKFLQINKDKQPHTKMIQNYTEAIHRKKIADIQ